MAGRASLPISKTKGDPKSHKKFLADEDALKLAASIAKVQEDKASSRIEKQRSHQAGHPHLGRKGRVSASKIKQNETMVILAAQRARKKREKVKLRKVHSRSQSTNRTVPLNSTDNGSTTSVPRKKVTFA